MMTYNEFHKLYCESAAKLLSSMPKNGDISAAYRSYSALVQFTGKDGELEFSKKANRLKFVFCPIQNSQND